MIQFVKAIPRVLSSIRKYFETVFIGGHKPVVIIPIKSDNSHLIQIKDAVVYKYNLSRTFISKRTSPHESNECLLSISAHFPLNYQSQ